MPETPQQRKLGRIPSLTALSDEALMARRELLAEDVGPKLLTLEALDDELMHRRRELQRQRILTPPWEQDPTPDAPLMPDLAGAL